MDKIKPTPEQQIKRIEKLVLIIKSNLKFKDFKTIIEHIKLFRDDPFNKKNPRELNDWFIFLTERVNEYNASIDFNKEQVKLILEYCGNSFIGLINVSNKNYNLVDKMAINFDTNFLDDFEFCIFKSIDFWKSIK